MTVRIRIDHETSEQVAEAIAQAVANHLSTGVEVYLGQDEHPIAKKDAISSPGKDSSDLNDTSDTVGPTVREETLREQIAEIEAGGPEKYKKRLGEQNKLFVRDRLALWFGDDGLTFEDGRFAAFTEEDKLPADGLLTGAATFEDRSVHVMANDYTVKAGSMAERGVEKFLRLQERALKTGRPILYLMDSSGGRIDQQSGFFANREGIGKYYFNHSLLSGKVPQICVLYGPCIAGAAYTPVFADFTIMVEGMSAMAIASPRMVERVTGEEISMQDLGGATMHAMESGSADLIARDETHARELVANLISYLPDNCDDKPQKIDAKPPKKSPEGVDSVIPQKPNVSYQMNDVIERIIDANSFFELQPRYGPEIITGFAHLGGRPIGIVANEPASRAGAIFPKSAEKAAQFVWKCDAYNIPLLYLCDTPGFMAGSQVEQEGILEKGKKMIYATSEATVPKVSVVIRKAYGAGIYAMSGPAFDPEGTLALPSGEIGIMGPEAAINAVYANTLAEIDDPDERRDVEEELQEEFREDINVHNLASDVVIDEIIPPSDLRDELIYRFDFYETVSKERPSKKHGTIL